MSKDDLLYIYTINSISNGTFHKYIYKLRKKKKKKKKKKENVTIV